MWGMKKYFSTALYLLLFGTWHAAMAQNAGRYEYWIDSEYGRHVEYTGSIDSISLSVPLENITPGLHFFNFRAVNSAGETGNLFRTMFYFPERQATDVQVTFCEYWVDDDFANHVQEKSGDSLMLTWDVSHLQPGLHFFNFRAVNGAGEVGSLMRTMFYLPEHVIPDVAGYEYWIDEDVDNAVSVDARNGNVYMTVDVSLLSMGEHTFNFRAKNSFDQWGPVYSETFVLEVIAGVESLKADVGVFDVYNLAGLLILKNATLADVKSLPMGIYIVGGKKVVVK